MDTYQILKNKFSSDTNASFWQTQANRFLAISSPAHSFYQQRSLKVTELIKRYVKPCRSLDVGAAGGDLVLALWQAGFDTYATDISKPMLEAAMQHTDGWIPDVRFRFRLTQGDTAPFPDRFPLLTAIGVLPYVADHRLYITYLSNMIETNGWLVISNIGKYSLYTMIQLGKHFLRFSLTRNWFSLLGNIWKTGLPSAGFLDDHSQQIKSVYELENLLKSLGYECYETISFYNITCFDRYPDRRRRFSRMMARVFGWSHVIIARDIRNRTTLSPFE